MADSIEALVCAGDWSLGNPCGRGMVWLCIADFRSAERCVFEEEAMIRSVKITVVMKNVL